MIKGTRYLVIRNDCYTTQQSVAVAMMYLVQELAQRDIYNCLQLVCVRGGDKPTQPTQNTFSVFFGGVNFRERYGTRRPLQAPRKRSLLLGRRKKKTKKLAFARVLVCDDHQRDDHKENTNA